MVVVVSVNLDFDVVLLCFLIMFFTFAHEEENGCANQEYHNYCDEDPQPNF
jgi:hypothetical protein